MFNPSRMVVVASVVAGAVAISLVGRAYRPGADRDAALHKVERDAEQPLDELYFMNKRGLRFGVPGGAYREAVSRMRAMEHQLLARRALSARAGSAPPSMAWAFIGPRPMQQLANFGGAILSEFSFQATGRITTIAVDPHTPRNVFVGAAGGGLWRTTDSGKTFQPVFDGQATQAIGSLVLDPNTTPSTVYAGTGEGNTSGDSYYGQGLFKSTDLGTTWTALAAGTFDHVGMRRLAIDTSHTPPNLFAATTSSVFSDTRTSAAFNEADPTKHGLWRSTDGGQSWSQYSGPLFDCNCSASDVVVDPSNPRDVYAAMYGHAVLRSTDGGDSWNSVCFTNDSPCTYDFTKTGRISIAISGASSPSTVYVIVGAASGKEYVGFYASTDAGETWSLKTVPGARVFDFNSLFSVTLDGNDPNNYGQSSYDQSLLADPTDAQHVFFGGVGIYESSDGGESWTFLADGGGTHCDQHALAAVVSGPKLKGVLLGNDGGLFSFNPGRRAFTPLNSAISAGQIQGIGLHPTDNDIVLAGFQDNGTQFFTGGLDWAAPQTGDGGVALFDHVDPGYAYHTYATLADGPELSQSTDGGKHWHFASAGLWSVMGSDKAGFYPPLAVDPAVAHRVLLGAHHTYVSTDGMLTWQQQASADLTGGCADGTCALQDIQFAASDHTKAWALSTQSGSTQFKLFTTTQADQNSGATWTDVTAKLEAAFPSGKTAANTQATSVAIRPDNPSVVYVALSGFTAATGIGHVYRTTDSGRSWTRADGTGGPSPLQDVPTLKLLFDATDSTRNTLLAGTDIGVFRSTDGGGTWEPFNLGQIPAVAAFDIAQNDNGKIVVGTHGRGAYQLVPLCGARPDPGCRQAARTASALQLKAATDPNKNTFSWTWGKGAAATRADFGDPANGGTTYGLCVYDGTGALVMTTTALPNGTCGKKPCWKQTNAATNSFKYTDSAATSDGLQQIVLTDTLKVKGKGINLVLPSLPLNQDAAITVQFKNSAGVCWEASYSAPASKNDSLEFRDKSD